MRVSFDLGEKRLGGILDEAAALDGFLEPELKRRFIGDSNETATATMPMLGLPIRYESADAEDPEDFESIFEAAASAPSKKRERTTEWVHENDYEDLESEHLAESDANGTEADDPVASQSTDTDYSKINMLESHRTLGKVIYPNLYRRPVAPPVDPIVEDLVFQHVETTYDMDMRHQVPVVRIWGVTAQGNSVLVEDRTFLPYFFVAIPTQAEQDSIHERLEAFLLERFHTSRVAKLKGEAAKSPPRPFERYVESMQVEPEARPLQGPDVADVRMVRVTLRSPSHVSAARNALEQANRAVVPNASRYITYEANVPFELRYMIDHGIYGCQWLRLLAGTCDLPKQDETLQSRAQYEWRITKKPSGGRKKWDPIDTDKRGDIGPKRILSYDIEVLRKEAGFPTADKNPIIMIACALRVAGQKAPVQHKVCFVLRCKQTRKHVGQSNGSYFPLESAKENVDEGQDAPTTVYVFDDERDLLMAWRQYVIESDPDAFSGWNIDNFDMPYMAGRASALGIYDQFMCFTRTIKKRCWIRESRFESKAYGVRINKELLCEGRFSFDGLLFMHRGQTNKYPSYKLNYFSKLFLKDEKLDVDYSQIPILFEGTDEDRTRLLWYCMKDTLLALRILDKLMAIVNGVEQCRVTGVPLKWLLIRGQGVKTFSALLRKKQPKEHPASRSPPARPTAGGHVEEPRRGFYTTPIVTVDFASLYPSIMRAYNICYTTKVSRAWAEANLTPNDYHNPWPSVDAIPPEGSEPETKKRKKKLSKKERDRVTAEAERAGKQTDFVFVKEHIRKGILPDMLEEFMKARSNVKNMMKKMSESDDLYCVFDGRQLALKIVCNSAYGFTKGFTVRDEDLMEAVTSWGRHLWEQVASKVLAHFRGRRVINCTKSRAAGVDPEKKPDLAVYEECNPIIVYGDTDSVMFNFGDITLAEAIRFGKEIAALCNVDFPSPISLAFETIKLVALFLNRKRYAALQLERFIEGETMAKAIERAQKTEANTAFKGLESKRRDNAPIGGGTQGRVLEILLWEQNVTKAEDYVKQTISDLLMGQVDMSQLVITKGLSKSEEQYARGGTKQQHVELRKRIQKRALETGEMVPETGDRVPYVMVSGTARKKGKNASKSSELSEDPLYAMRRGVPIDTDYYINKQIMPAVLRVFTGIYEPERCWEIESAMSDEKLHSFKAYQKLFARHLPHMQKRRTARVRNYGIAAFAQVLPACLGCGTRLAAAAAPRPGHGGVCRRCVRIDVVRTKVVELAQKTKACKDAWATCRKCQGGAFGKVTCSNMSCGNFFHREKVITDLEDICNEIARF